jgi:hypothetical protein
MFGVSKFVQRVAGGRLQGAKGKIQAATGNLQPATGVDERTIALGQVWAQVSAQINALDPEDWNLWHWLQDLYYDEGRLFAITISAGRLYRWPVTAGSAGSLTGAVPDGLPLTVCGPGVRVEMGQPCYIECCGFGEIRLMSNELKNGGTNTAYCKERDVYTVDFGQGSRLVSNDEEWWLAVMGGQLLEILAQRAVAGDSGNVFTNTMVPNDSDGLYKYLTKSYPECPQLNPFVLDWGSNPACDYGSTGSPTGMTGITLNGLEITSPKYAMNLYVTLRAIFRETMKRIRGTRMLGNRTPQPGDLAILLPDWAIECLIECAICHVICRDDYTRRDSEMAAMKYDEWLTGWNGLPYLVFDRMVVPLIAFNPLDWRSYDVNNPTAGVRGLLENADGSFNLFMLWRGIGGNQGRRFLELQYNDLSDGTFDTANDGAIQLWDDECGRCYTLNMAMEWRWCGDAPFLQTLVSNINCDRLFGSYNLGPLMPAG